MNQEPVIPEFGEASGCVEENRFFCPDWVRDNWSDVLQPALFQHVKLTLIAVAAGFALAFVAALVAHRYGARRRARSPRSRPSCTRSRASRSSSCSSR